MAEESLSALVTGASSGIGRAIALDLVAHGWSVVACGRDSEKGRHLLSSPGLPAGKLRFVQADVGDEASVATLFGQLPGRLDLLCNNAGIEIYRKVDAYDVSEFDQIVQTNLRGQFLCARAAIPLLQRTRGSIVNISSVQAFANEPDISAYAATKAGILALTRGMAVDLAERGIRVNAVCPGAIAETGMTDDAAAQSPDFTARIPLGRAGRPIEVAAAVRFLASPCASYITGTSLTVDGGLLARLAL